jgi:hypothetical protein
MLEEEEKEESHGLLSKLTETLFSHMAVMRDANLVANSSPSWVLTEH